MKTVRPLGRPHGFCQGCLIARNISKFQISKQRHQPKAGVSVYKCLPTAEKQSAQWGDLGAEKSEESSVHSGKRNVLNSLFPAWLGLTGNTRGTL